MFMHTGLKLHKHAPTTSSVYYRLIITGLVDVMPAVLTVEGIPGDLTSHGWMQGAFTSSLSKLPQSGFTSSCCCASSAATLYIQTRRRFSHTQSPDSDSATGCVCPKPHRHEAAAADPAALSGCLQSVQRSR